MIISHTHKFIFIKTQKTAGTSLEIALSQICGPNDIITPISENDEAKRKELGYPTAQNYFIPFSKYSLKDWAKFILQQKKATFYNHISASKIKHLVSDEVWDGYYKFCFDRNPWDKFVSWYYWKNTESTYDSIEDFANAGMLERLKGFSLYSIAGKVVVDDVFAFEDISAALDSISNKLRLETPLVMPDYRAKSNSRKDLRHYRELLPTDIVERIRTFSAAEIELLGYTF